MIKKEINLKSKELNENNNKKSLNIEKEKIEKVIKKFRYLINFIDNNNDNMNKDFQYYCSKLYYLN